MRTTATVQRPLRTPSTELPTNLHVPAPLVMLRRMVPCDRFGTASPTAAAMRRALMRRPRFTVKDLTTTPAAVAAEGTVDPMVVEVDDVAGVELVVGAAVVVGVELVVGAAVVVGIELVVDAAVVVGVELDGGAVVDAAVVVVVVVDTSMPATCTAGELGDSMSESPVCPYWLSPAHHTEPAVVSTQTVAAVPETPTTPLTPPYATTLDCRVADVDESCPMLLPPRHDAVPEESTAHTALATACTDTIVPAKATVIGAYPATAALYGLVNCVW